MRYFAWGGYLCILPVIVAASIKGPAINVCIVRGDPTLDVQYARVLASSIFGNVGIGVDWHCPTRSSSAIVVDLSGHPGARDYLAVLAYAEPYTRRIQVFPNRIQAFHVEWRSRVLAYVLAHEITHVLQGVSRHSPSGIMKAHWSEQDLEDIFSRRLMFERYDIQLIFARLKAEAIALDAPSPAQPGPLLAAVPRR